MRKERNKSQIGKRIMAFVLTLLLMNSTIAYLIPTQEVKAGADYNITSKGLLGGYYDNTPTDYSNQIDETFTWHSASYNPEGAPDTVPKTATLTYYTAETDYDLLPELGPVIAEPTNSENSGAASEGAAPVYIKACVWL